MNEIIENFYEIDALDNDQFLKVKETLTRIGISSRNIDNKSVLNQTCHVLYKQDRYYIVHFKQMFLLDGKQNKTNYTEQDKARTQKIVELLSKWGLITVVNTPCYDTNGEQANITIIPYKDKHNWILTSKYEIGVKHYE